MSRFATQPRLQFAQPKQAVKADEKGIPSTVSRANVRRTAALQDARAVLTVLPAPGEALHAIITGRFDLMHLVLALLERLPSPEYIRIATLSFNARNLTEMLTLLDREQPPRLTLLASAFFRDHNKELWSETLTEFRDRKQQVAAARSHAKVVTIMAGKERLSLEGSANLRSNSNREQICLINDPGVHDWHATWIDDLVSKHEPENEEYLTEG
jgi:hypothetical protein